ncbi:MAG: AI-2E family transporter [Bacteriovoracia bacterium]
MTFFLILMTTLLVAVAFMMRPFGSALLAGVILALTTYRFYGFLARRWGGKRSAENWAAAIVTALVTLGIVLPVLSFTVTAIEQGAGALDRLSQSSNQFWQQTMASLNEEIARYPIVQRYLGAERGLDQQINDGIRSALKFGTSQLLGWLGHLPGMALQLLVALLTCFFLLRQGKPFLRWLQGTLPLEAEVQHRIFHGFRTNVVRAFVASLAAAAAQAGVMFLALIALGAPVPFFAAGLTFLLAWIPVISCSPVWLGMTAYFYFTGAPGKAMLMLAAGGLTSIVDNLARALVLNGGGNMPTLVALLAAIGGVYQFGLIGLLLGPILAGTLLTFLQIWRDHYQTSYLRRDESPRPAVKPRAA